MRSTGALGVIGSGCPGRAALAVHSSPPDMCPGAAWHCWQQHIYHRPGRFAHLTDVHRLASDITTLL